MAEGGKGLGVIEAVSLIVIALFAAVVVFWIFSWLAGALWWAIKIAALIAVLFLLVRWAFRRSTR